ncbi:MAG: hypothetical protein RL022_2554 [Chloroflexota bacterium]|jgi:hypothetical protein
MPAGACAWWIVRNRSRGSTASTHHESRNGLGAATFCSQLLGETGTEDWFVLVRVTVTEGRAGLVYADGNDRDPARQGNPYTDLPLDAITLYACWDTEHWVIMLPSEY